MWKKRRNNKEKIPIPANKPKTPAAALAAFGSVVVVVTVVSVVVVDVSGVVVPPVLIYILESDFREACHKKVWTMKSILC
jgi:hypothetical protein